MKTLRVKVVHGLADYTPGQVVSVRTDDEGTPLELFWRRRMRDATIDGCVEVVQDVPLKPSEGAAKRARKKTPRRRTLAEEYEE